MDTAKPPVNWKKAFQKLSNVVDSFTDADSEDHSCHFCIFYCPAKELCDNDDLNNDGRCRRILRKWAKQFVLKQKETPIG